LGTPAFSGKQCREQGQGPHSGPCL